MNERSVPSPASTSKPLLFEPLDVAGLRLKNRIVMAPMGTCLDNDGFVSERTIAYYRRRAEGGAGTITVEATLVSPDVEGPEPRIHGPEFEAGFRSLVDALRPFDVTVGLQLLHPGRQVSHGKSVAPSPVPLNSRAPVPHELTAAEIEQIVADFAAAAAHTQNAGFDFVEIHGAHGYLPSDFLSPLTNRRSDSYGGSLENRARFSIEILNAIRGRCGPEFPIFHRVSAEEGIEGGFEIDEILEVCRWIERAGAACISVSSGTWHSLHMTLAPMFMGRGHLLAAARRVKNAVNIPVIAVGRLDHPELAAQVVTRGDADLVAIGRGLIADADWPRKLEAGLIDEIRPCIACNACVDLVGQGQEARCAVNPEVGRESVWKLETAAASRRVLVVGSGPAGMEAARIARLRGHQVTICEQEAELGGKLDVASRAPSKGEVLRFRDYQARTLKDLGVEIRLETVVSPEFVEATDPDVVVVATGAEPLVPPIPGIGSAHVVDAQELLRRQAPVRTGEHVVVIGGSATGCETAETLVEHGAVVTILEMLPAIGQGIESITRRHLVKTLKQRGVQIRTLAKVTAIDAEMVFYENVADGSTASVPAETVALALGWRPRGSVLAGALPGRRVLVLGDASKPADFVNAVGAGADAGFAA